MKAMILAAGFGTRLKPYTSVCPKPLFPVMGEPLLLRIINALRRSGFTQILVNAHHLKEQIVDVLRDEPGVVVQVEPFELGTGGGLRMAIETLGDGPVLVTNADIYHNIDYGWAYESHCRGACGATLVMHDYPRFNKVQVSPNNEITSFRSEDVLQGGAARMAFTGIHVLETDLLKSIPAKQFYNIIDAYSLFIHNGGSINALIARNHFWYDIGTPADYLDLHGRLLTGSVQSGGERQGQDPYLLGSGVLVDQGVRFKDWAYVGNNVHIGAGSHLERVVVWDGVHIPAGTRVKDEIVL